ncbi:MAG: OadG family protein [bacterium]|nr:OadG family protein [bacterium]
MIDPQAGIQNIVDGQGAAIAIAGMSIVFAALTLISVVIALLPRILSRIEGLFPEPVVATPRSRAAPIEDLTTVAAAAAAYHAARSGVAPG